MEGFVTKEIYVVPRDLQNVLKGVPYGRHLYVTRELKKNNRGRRRRQAKRIFPHNPCVFPEHVFALVTLFVSSFAEIQLPSVCIPERKD